MKCTNCKLKLTRKQYENINIHACECCFGTLVRLDRMKAIESRRDKSEDELLDEVAGAGADSLHPVRCPNCYKNMLKRKKKFGPAQFSVDRCDKCQLIWLDAGELAKMQVVYEFSEKGEEALRFRERLENMTPAEKLELEERIANLPERTFEFDDSDYRWFNSKLIDYLDVWDF